MRDVWVRRPSAKEKSLLEDCPIWEHDPETWDAQYDDREETCMIIEGNAYVTLEDESIVRFSKGDLVTFKPHLKCSWTVDEAIKKHYIFNM